ncbi:MAG: beta-class carbonic anhydrase [Nitrososphaerales archaeon]
MSETEKLLNANEEYARKEFPGKLPMPPSRHVAVLACMDARLTVSKLLGLKTGEAHIIRNAGGIATEDAIRSLIISSELLGTREFLVINHTDCGMLTFKDEELARKLSSRYGHDASRIKFHSFSNLENNVREQVETIKNHPLIQKSITVNGFVYDVGSGRLEKIA